MARFSGLTRGLITDSPPKVTAASLPSSVVFDGATSPKDIDSTGVADTNVLAYDNASGKFKPAAASGASGVTGWYDVTRAPYNAVGNGSTDDTAAIQAAITACGAAGGGVVYFPPKSAGYRIAATGPTIPSNVTLLGAGPTASYFLFDDVAAFGFRIDGSVTRTDNLTSNLAQDSRTPVIAGAALSNYSIGSEVLLQDNALSAIGDAVSLIWFNRVADVTLPTAGMFMTEQRFPGLPLTTANTARVSLLSVVASVQVRDLGFVVPGTPGSASHRSSAFSAHYARDVTWENCRFTNFANDNTGFGNPISPLYCRDLRLNNLFFDRCLDSLAITGVSNTRCIDAAGCTDVTITNIRGRRVSGLMNFTQSCYVTIDGVAGSGGTVPLVKPPVVAGSLVAGGTLTNGVQCSYQVTSTNAFGETVGSTVVNVTPSGGNLTVRLTWPSFGGNQNVNADGYKVYRTAGGPSQGLLTTLNGGTFAYNDTGGAASGGSPPASSTTNADTDVWGNRGVKLYSGNYYCRVKNCMLHDFDQTGIYLHDTYACQVEGNTIYGARDNGIHLEAGDEIIGSVCLGNKFKGNTVYGIWGPDTGAGNRGSGKGMDIGGQNTTIEDNTIINCASPQAAMLVVGNDANVQGNVVINSVSGMLLGEGSGGNFTGTTNGTTTVSAVSSFANINVGCVLKAADIPVGTRVQSVNTGASTLVMTAAATGSNVGETITASGNRQPSGCRVTGNRTQGTTGGGSGLDTTVSAGSNFIGDNILDKGYSLHVSDVSVGAGANPFKPSTQMSYSASITPNFAAGEFQLINVSNGTAFTVNNPTNMPGSNQTGKLTIEIVNSSGGAMGVITWGSSYKFALGAFTNPASTKRRALTFDVDRSGLLICTSMSTADV